MPSCARSTPLFVAAASAAALAALAASATEPIAAISARSRERDRTWSEGRDMVSLGVGVWQAVRSGQIAQRRSGLGMVSVGVGVWARARARSRERDRTSALLEMVRSASSSSAPSPMQRPRPTGRGRATPATAPSSPLLSRNSRRRGGGEQKSCMVQSSENGDLGGLRRKSHRFLRWSEEPGLSSRVRRAVASLRARSEEPVEARYGAARRLF